MLPRAESLLFRLGRIESYRDIRISCGFAASLAYLMVCMVLRAGSSLKHRCLLQKPVSSLGKAAATVIKYSLCYFEDAGGGMNGGENSGFLTDSMSSYAEKTLDEEV